MPNAPWFLSLLSLIVLFNKSKAFSEALGFGISGFTGVRCLFAAGKGIGSSLGVLLRAGVLLHPGITLLCDCCPPLQDDWGDVDDQPSPESLKKWVRVPSISSDLQYIMDVPSITSSWESEKSSVIVIYKNLLYSTHSNYFCSKNVQNDWYMLSMELYTAKKGQLINYPCNTVNSKNEN